MEDAAPLLFVILIGAAFFGLKAAFRNPADRRFSEPIDEYRLIALHRLFDLSEAECRQIRFDGGEFRHRTNAPYRFVTRIRVVSSANVEATHADQPHRKTWLHRRVGGGPDRRYSFNPETRTTTRVEIIFDAGVPLEGRVYDDGYSKDFETRVLMKWQRFVAGGNELGYEDLFLRVGEAYRQLEADRITAEQSTLRLATIEAALSARRLLGSAAPEHPTETDLVRERRGMMIDSSRSKEGESMYERLIADIREEAQARIDRAVGRNLLDSEAKRSART